MIAVPWFKFPWSAATADLAHALALSALHGDAEAKGQLDEIESRSREGNKKARKAWRYFSAVIRLAVAGQPPPSVILQMRRRAAVGHHHGGGFPGGVMMGPFSGGYPYGPGADPWMLEEMASQYDVGGGGGHHHGHHGGGGFGYPWGGYYEPFYYGELLQSVAERAAEDAAAETSAKLLGKQDDI